MGRIKAESVKKFTVVCSGQDGQSCSLILAARNSDGDIPVDSLKTLLNVRCDPNPQAETTSFIFIVEFRSRCRALFTRKLFTKLTKLTFMVDVNICERYVLLKPSALAAEERVSSASSKFSITYRDIFSRL